MAINITCASCGSEYAVRDDVAGKKVRCSNCQAVIEVPGAIGAEPSEVMSETEKPDSEPVRCGFATASLIFGIFGFIPCIGQLLPIIFGFVALSKISRSKGRMTGKRMAVAGLVLGFAWILIVPVIAITAGLIFPAITKSREQARRAACKSNLKQIGLAVAMYRNDYNEFPPAGGKDSLENLSFLFDSYISARNVFRCPSTNDDPGGIRPGEPLLPHQCSYEYIALAPTGPDGILPPDTIIAFDKDKGNHRWRGRNVLFKDGHVEWMQEWSFKRRFDDQWELRDKYRIAPRDIEIEEEVMVEEGEVLKIEIEER